MTRASAPTIPAVPTRAAGGSAYAGRLGSNHFWPRAPFSERLWPGRWAAKVVQSAAGVAGVLALLGLWARRCGAATVWAFYGGPYLVVNAWLIVYTWLQHTDVDVPHLADREFSYMRGAFLTVDRPYGRVFDWLHHKIGSTHVAHHIDCTIPHYHAQEATAAIAAGASSGSPPCSMIRSSSFFRQRLV